MAAKVFLGGTCNGSRWREQLKPLLEVDYFDPVVDDWNDEAFQRELFEKAHDDYLLYCITPKMAGSFAVAELIDDSNKQPGKTLVCVLDDDEGARFSEHQQVAMGKVCDMAAENGATVFTSLQDVARYLNAC